MFWKPAPQLILSNEAIQTAIEPPDLVEEFGIDDKWFPEYRATLGRGHKFRFSYVTLSYDEEATINRTFTFQGRTLTVGAPAVADVEWDLWKLGYEWDFVANDQGYFGVTADLRLNEITATVDSPVLRSPAMTDTTAPVPTIGVAGRGYVSGALAIGGEFSGLKITRDEFEVKFLDFDIHATISVSRNVGAQVGYRSLDADYVVDDDTGDLEMRGVYLGGFVRF